MWDLVGNPEDRFSHNEAQFICYVNLFLFTVQLFGYSIGVFKLIAWISAPWAITRALINGVMMVEAFRSFAEMDTEKRAAQRQQNGLIVHEGNVNAIPNGVVMTAAEHEHHN